MRGTGGFATVDTMKRASALLATIAITMGLVAPSAPAGAAGPTGQIHFNCGVPSINSTMPATFAHLIVTTSAPVVGKTTTRLSYTTAWASGATKSGSQRLTFSLTAFDSEQNRVLSRRPVSLTPQRASRINWSINVPNATAGNVNLGAFLKAGNAVYKCEAM